MMLRDSLAVSTLRDATVVDTTGAGDAFIAGYIMSLVAQNLPFDHCISFDRDDRNPNDNISDDALCNLTMFRLLGGSSEVQEPRVPCRRPRT